VNCPCGRPASDDHSDCDWLFGEQIKLAARDYAPVDRAPSLWDAHDDRADFAEEYARDADNDRDDDCEEAAE